MNQLVMLRILVFLLVCVIVLLCLMVFQMAQAERDTLAQYEIASHADHRCATILKDSFKAHLKASISSYDIMTPFELWAWTVALREILLEMNRHRDNLGSSKAG